ncbi:MAG: HPr(Ser) kinase/phosphatase [Oscillospiraceae bacterium]|jgi:HPr kinase/phosphorylase|nr:HPr(Ser) kinase/phosphatase [Oscillospiraceae bacterium]
MSDSFTVSLNKIIKDLSLKVLLSPVDPSQVLVSSSDVSFPGLELAGFLDFFDKSKILIFGSAEHTYLDRLSPKKRLEIIDKLLSFGPPAIIMTHGITPHKEMVDSAKKNFIHILSTSDKTSVFVASLVPYLNLQLAPRISRHGVLVEVCGEGLLITGDSGIGKSETAVELIKRGHRLIADDAVEIRKVSNKTLIGSSPSNIRYFVELRGIGIVNTRSIFGTGSVKGTGKIDVVVQLEDWEDWSQSKICDRIGINSEYIDILGNKLPFLRIPVKPGRNLAVIVEIIAINSRQKKMGQNAAKELLLNFGINYEQTNLSKQN